MGKLYTQTNTTKLTYWLIMLLIVSSSQSYANPHLYDRQISQIRVFGNESTQTRFVLKWANLSPGDILTRDTLRQARQNILDTALFKRANLNTFADGEHIGIDIELEEKHFTLLLPRLDRNSNGDVKSGLKLRMHNIGGANQTLNMLVEQTELSNGDDDQKYRIEYKLPQYSKPYYFKWRLSQSTRNTTEDGFLNTEFRDFLSFSIARNFQSSIFRQSLILSTSLKFERVRLDTPYPASFNEIEAGDFHRLGLDVEYNTVHRHRFKRLGRHFSLSYKQGFTELKSDYISRILEFESMVFRPLNSLDNFNSRVFLGVSKDSPFNSPFYDLGGAGNVRGVERDAFSGDALVFGNFEYVMGYHEYPGFRSSLFVDIGNVYDDVQSIDLGDIYSTIGVGMRWKLTSFIKTDLFIDIAYNPKDQETFVYGGTSLNF